MIGERLNQLRKSRNMTQKELAELLMVSPNTISLYERDQSTPTDESKVQLAKLFHVSVDYLVGNTDEESSKVGAHTQVILFHELPPPARVELGSFLDYFKEKYNL